MELRVTSLNFESFLNNKCQRVVFDGQSSVWKSVTTGVPQVSVLGPLFFLIYINDLPLGLTTDVKLFEDGTSLFSVVNSASVSASSPNNNLVKMRNWAFNWKISFNPDPTIVIRNGNISPFLMTMILLNKWKRLFFQEK